MFYISGLHVSVPRFPTHKVGTKPLLLLNLALENQLTCSAEVYIHLTTAAFHS